MKLVIYDLNKLYDKKKFDDLKKNKKVRIVSSDFYLDEIVKIRNPHISDNLVLDKLRKELKASTSINYAVYFPWKNVVCLIPSKKIFFELVTARNKHLITSDEQHKLRNTTVAFFGMSVGSQAALTWMLQSRADNIIIVDHDTIDPSNLNRIRFGIDSLGLHKVDATYRNLSETNPFSNILSYKKADLDELENIISSSPSATVIVDEIDDIKAKYALRKIAKRLRVPLVSATDVGDNVVLDVERYDLNPQPEPFLGRLPEINTVDLDKITRMELLKMIIRLVGFDADADRIPESIMSIGGSLRTWPQLGATATIAGGVVATTIKKIVCGERVPSGRYNFSLDEVLNSDYNTRELENMRKKKVAMVNVLMTKV